MDSALEGETPVINVGRRIVGPGQPCLIIAEVGQNHDGSLGQAHAFVEALAAAGADGVKFQTHLAHAESSPEEPWRVKFSYEDATRFEYQGRSQEEQMIW